LDSPYDPSSPTQILQYARYLEGGTVAKALKELYSDWAHESSPGYIDPSITETYKGKGGFGQFIEKQYFKKDLDSYSRPDFEQAGIELKTAPLRKNQRGEVRAKERIVLGNIDFSQVVNESFSESHFLSKNETVLLVFYFHDALKSFYDLEIPLVDIWKCLQEDGKQIKEDWEYIVQKVRNGLAHEISEGDTYYLGACTKGAMKATSQVRQPYSDIEAHRRAFCFKVGYVNHIYKVLRERQKKRKKTDYIRLLDDKPLSLEQQIHNRFNPYLGMRVDDICKTLEIPYNLVDKGLYARVARTILGIRKKDQKIYEFDAADVQVKTIRIEPNGVAKEEMSFRAIRYNEITDEEWEDSELYQILTSKFFFVIYKHNNKEDPYTLAQVKIWNMPESDLDIAKGGWEDTKQKIIDGNYNDFIKIRDRRIIHVRTHGRDSSDLMETPQGTWQTKRSFWLNKRYVAKHIHNHN
jgi:DNA mismatch repair protein MutH